MTTQIQSARQGLVTEPMRAVAAQEGLPPELVRERVALGHIVIPCNPGRPSQQTVGIGAGLRTKVNASIGTSSDICDLAWRCARRGHRRGERGRHPDGAHRRRRPGPGAPRSAGCAALPVGNVPLYQAFCEAARKYGDPNRLDPEYLFELIERQLADGMSFMAVHCGINRFTLERLRKQGYRYGGLVTKGGTFLVSWMEANHRENPLYEQFDRVAASWRSTTPCCPWATASGPGPSTTATTGPRWRKWSSTASWPNWAGTWAAR